MRYLAANMLRESVKSQIVALVCGKGINARLAKKWINYIRIEFQPLQEQQQFVQSVILEDYALQELNAKKQEQGFKHAIRLRKHALIQNISAFDSLFRSLEYCMRDHNDHIKVSYQISPISPMTVGEAMGILHSELETISYRVEHLTEALLRHTRTLTNSLGLSLCIYGNHLRPTSSLRIYTTRRPANYSSIRASQ